MGVPGLFSSLIRDFKKSNIIIKNIDNDLPNHFYLDFNCAIYTALYSNPGIKTEETLIIYVIEYLETLCRVIPQLELIYIALDGVPSQAKMVTQRERRFHSICRKNRTTKINQIFGSEIEKTEEISNFDTNSISPGTTFMYLLSRAIKDAIANGGRNNIFKNKMVIFSDASIPGEGENKIMLFIKNSQHLAIDGNIEERNLYGNEHNTIIYGLDGDLIFLSLLMKTDNTYLFREANEYGNLATIYEGKKYLFMDINALSYAILDDFKKYSPNIDMINRDKYIDDYIVLGMILGNDFMPKNHWYSIHEGGMNRILSSYFQIHNHTEIFLMNSATLQINTEMLTDIWFLVKENEYDAVCKLFEKRKKAKIYVKPEMNEKERQQMLTDFYPLQHLYVEQEIAPHLPNWQTRYYKVCFNMDNTPDNISMICQMYIKTFIWNILYYFDECPSWTHYYPFAYAPIFSDIYNELLKYKNINSSSNKVFKFTPSNPIDQQTLLFCILPFSSRHFMISDASHKLLEQKCSMNIYFPKRYGLNVAFHRYYHECTPIIYKLDMVKVKKFIKECKFSEDELHRNVIGDLFIRKLSVSSVLDL